MDEVISLILYISVFFFFEICILNDKFRKTGYDGSHKEVLKNLDKLRPTNNFSLDTFTVNKK
jgi:hypothetical protein